MENGFYTPQETARILKISVRTLERRRVEGAIKSTKDGGLRFYSVTAIKKYLAENRKEK
ncbi:helix-turn-helix domain-containing protein [Terasakiella pusilla]|uniref:helix-turn-helix domain-containing protein n=1 Tax=Terasakiella pusilla TaxID=64973 RepID=UPI003AA7B46C